MSNPVATIWSIAGLVSAAALGPALVAGLTARGEAAAAVARHSSVCRQAEELARARGAIPSFMNRDRSDSALAPRVTGVLAQSGLPASTLTNLSADAAGQPVGRASKRRHAVLSLSGPTLPQLGRFLEQWRKAAPSWTVAGIDLGPMGPDGKSGQAGGDLPLRVVVGVETVYLEP